jgi:hypothetical protein
MPMMLTKSQLLSAKRLLKEALALVADAQGLFRDDEDTVRRLKAIGQALVDEIERVTQLLEAQ